MSAALIIAVATGCEQSHAPASTVADVQAFKWTVSGTHKTDPAVFLRLREFHVVVSCLPTNANAPRLELDFEACPSESIYWALQTATELSNVARIQLHGRALDANTIDLLQRFPELRYLDLSAGNLDDTLATKIASLGNLEFLVLWGTPLTDQSLPSLAKLSRLKSLDLSMTNLSGAGLTNLAKLQNLEELHLEIPNLDAAAVATLQAELPHTLVVH
jgi:Leucine-rich repeat (LRR) protein